VNVRVAKTRHDDVVVRVNYCGVWSVNCLRDLRNAVTNNENVASVKIAERSIHRQDRSTSDEDALFWIYRRVGRVITH